MKDITKIEKLAYQYYESNPKSADVFLPVRVSYEPNFYHFSSQGRIFNEIFKDNLDYYTLQINGIKALKRENAAIAMRSDD